ncbi:MAG: AAA family ATPase, partial [Bacteroidota bacterium]
AIHEQTGLDLVHLDQVYWQAHWKESTLEVFRKAVGKEVQKDNWVMDGNYSSTFDLRLPRATHIIFLDFPTYHCLYRILKRYWQHRGQTRLDMTAECPERINWEFIHYVLTYNWTRRAGIHKKLEKLKEKTKIFVLNNARQVAEFLESLPLQ